MRWAMALMAFGLLVSCKRTPMGRVEEIRDQLTSDEPRYAAALPACGARPTCASELATAIGSPFNETTPDQVSAAAVAVLVAREHRGDGVASADVWLAAMRKATGPGADALRLGVALAMMRVATKYSTALDPATNGRAFLKDITGALPGACKTYVMLGDGADPDAMDPVLSPDHSACVQKDLLRKGGPGAAFGFGLPRGIAGAVTLWIETTQALRDGSAATGAKYKETLERRIKTIEDATAKMGNIAATTAAPTYAAEHDKPLGGQSDAGAVAK